LIGHVLVVVLTMLFVALGFWQLGRHQDQRTENDVIEQRIAAEPVPLPPTDQAPGFELQQVTVTGRYDYAAQLELRPRARNGRLGYDQVVPLQTSRGVVLVNRGFIPDVDGLAREVDQLGGEISVTGTVQLSEGTSRFGPQNPDEGQLAVIARIDIERLDPQFGGALYPAYLDLVAESPDPGGLTTVLPTPPGPTSRPHLLYALQWWSFALITSVGWVVYLRRQFFSG
jgi:cytochrome oxidase assembly protein ShyY1